MNNANNQMVLNGTTYEYRGKGYTRAFIVVGNMRTGQFIGYIPTKDEWIIATKFTEGSYGWTKYFSDMDSIIDHLKDISTNSYHIAVNDFLGDFQGDYETQTIMNGGA